MVHDFLVVIATIWFVTTPEKVGNPCLIVRVSQHSSTSGERGVCNRGITPIVVLTTDPECETIWTDECCTFVYTGSMDNGVRMEDHMEVANIGLGNCTFNEAIPQHAKCMIGQPVLMKEGVTMHIKNMDRAGGVIIEWCDSDSCSRCLRRYGSGEVDLVCCSIDTDIAIAYDSYDTSHLLAALNHDGMTLETVTAVL